MITTGGLEGLSSHEPLPSMSAFRGSAAAALREVWEVKYRSITSITALWSAAPPKWLAAAQDMKPQREEWTLVTESDRLTKRLAGNHPRWVIISRLAGGPTRNTA